MKARQLWYTIKALIKNIWKPLLKCFIQFEIRFKEVIICQIGL